MKIYYRLNEEGYVDLYTSDKKVADRNGCTLTTDEEIVMQGDKSGYVLVSEYVAVDTRIDDLNKEFDACVSGLKDYLTEAQLMGDDELQEDIKAEYATLVAEYDKQIDELEV